jgi:hypothetical protein
MPQNSKKKQLTKKERINIALKKPFVSVKERTTALIHRRPHRSFKLTNRRDYKRSLKLPGFIAFTFFVNKTLWKHRNVFIPLVIFYAVLTAVFIGIGSQDTYLSLTTTLKDVSTEIFQGDLNQLGQAGLVFLSISTGGLTAAPTGAQQVYIIILGLLVWLTTVWLLRNLLAGHKVKMRDGLYSAGSPIISTLLVALALAVQLIPIGIAIVAYTAASAAGLLAGGVEAMLFWIAAILLGVMSIYWATSTFFALIIVTLPGTYPWRALRTAGDMVASRRLRILLRIVWMFVVVGLAGLVVIILIILLDTGLTNLWSAVSAVPIVPTVLMLFTVVSFIWIASYIYLLYRRVVDDDAKPA